MAEAESSWAGLKLSVGFFKFILAGCYLKSADHIEWVVAS